MTKHRPSIPYVDITPVQRKRRHAAECSPAPQLDLVLRGVVGLGVADRRRIITWYMGDGSIEDIGGPLSPLTDRSISPPLRLNLLEIPSKIRFILLYHGLANPQEIGLTSQDGARVLAFCKQYGKVPPSLEEAWK